MADERAQPEGSKRPKPAPLEVQNALKTVICGRRTGWSKIRRIAPGINPGAGCIFPKVPVINM
jgi:hypothetical protein